MADKVVFSPCTAHSPCTVKTSWVPPGTPGYDPSTDRKPVSAFVQARAEEAFGSVFCIEVAHIPGTLDIRREE